MFESNAVTTLSAEELELIRNEYKMQLDSYGSLGVLELREERDGKPLLFLVLVTGCVSVGKVADTEVFRVTDAGFVSLRGVPQDGEKIQEIRRVLMSGTFYFSWSQTENCTFDLTLCVQRKWRASQPDQRFFWNRTLFHYFKRFGIDCEKWLYRIMCGAVVINTVYVGSQQARACLFSRLSCERAGTRFNVRGVNDEGHVANFVETEQVIYMPQSVASYIMIRGSVPLFWEQPGFNVGSHKVKMSRGSEVSQPAYDKHIVLVKKRYGKQHFITLCGSKEGEANLTRMYKAHHRSSQVARDVPLTVFDYHAQCPKGKEDNLQKLKQEISRHLSEYGFFSSTDGTVHCTQTGTFRVNCIDCLDRTNRVQTFIGLEILERQMDSLGLTDKPQVVSRFYEAFKNMWPQNGDQVSRIYSGTGALEGRSKIKDSTLSVARTIQNNLLDSSKQEAIDYLLMGGKSLDNEYSDRSKGLLPPSYMHLPPVVLKSVCDRHLEYTSPQKIRVVLGTWNVNGGKHFNSIVFKRSDPLSDWLLDYNKNNSPAPNIMDMSLHETLGEESHGPPDIYAIGFEEIVDLNAGNIVAASTSNQREWLVQLQRTISRDEPYVLVSSVQLVGVCLFLFVRPQNSRYIRDVGVDQVKTGLGGAAGNKGGVAIRFRYHSSSLVFICAHFAAGQHQVNERNSDFAEINRKMSFPMAKTINSHDLIFWCGDFNYRIDLDNDFCKDCVSQKDWETLLAAEQLTIQKKERQSFPELPGSRDQFCPHLQIRRQ